MKNLKLFIFVILLGGLTAGLIQGMDIITADRIKNNKNYEWKAAMLDHHGLSTGVGVYIELFDETFTSLDEEPDPINRVYRHKSLGTYSFFFTGNGLWGEINGVITLESDKITILKVTVLNQQETPGLGGVVSTREYLDNYVGVKFDPNISLSKPDNTSDPETQVDQITGATGTSNRFISILNNAYLLKMGDQI
ncbi:MAG: FMN-binding protein [Acholeplasmataceae bacterium]|nr:FMN-binding protein [Acholeplasmataceae bacterium]